ncbi:amino acid permease [Novosphingobium marinum]|nr:amino acid permease [Novosphingobium marinum]
MVIRLNASAKPLAGIDAVAIVVGIVVGAGIFRTPPLVAANLPGEPAILGVWIAGALLSLAGALCYAELASTFPATGGEYSLLRRAYGKRIAVLYGWSRLLVIQTGSLALLAYVYGDYATRLLALGPNSAALHAAIAISAITAIHWTGLRMGARAQRWLTALEIAGLGLLVLAALWAEPAATAPAAGPLESSSIGLALVFVLLTYGGWNEAAYLSAELEGPPARIARVLVSSIAVIAGAYLLVNYALIRALGTNGLAASDAPAADVLQAAWGPGGALLISLMVAAAALASAHGTILTGARSAHALGQDVRGMGWLARWDAERHSPSNALLLQGGIALLLVAAGAMARDGFQLAVEYTAPAFWFFFLAVGVSLFVFRARQPHMVRPFTVPLYPLVPAIFCASCTYLLYSSLAYTGIGALFSAGLMLSGVLLFPFLRADDRDAR